MPTRVTRRRAAIDTSPSQYIVKMDVATGEPLPGPIEPAALLVHAHRDRHPVQLAAQVLASRLIAVTGNEGLVKRSLRFANTLGRRASRLVGGLSGNPQDERRLERLLGVENREYHFRFREPRRLGEKELSAHLGALRGEARARLAALGKRPAFRVLLTGATGFLGKEILAQAALHPHLAEVVCVVRPESVRDPATRAVRQVLSAAERGTLLLKRLGLRGAAARRFRFIEGDVERPRFGLAPRLLAELASRITHVVHCAASVSFDASYESSFRANVLGCRYALELSKELQRRPGSPFVAHVAIETSYIHGRRKRSIASEEALVFPRHFYNNYYELTKAMASLETDRALVEGGLRVVQLLPAIVIGHSRTGNNRGDTKVVNAPINAFGRAREAVESLAGDWRARGRAWLLSQVATAFPADRSAELNLVSVDRVAGGILAALGSADAVGARIHLATDDRIRSEEVARIVREELGVKVRLVDPTLTRTLALPLVKAALLRLGEPKLAGVLDRLGTIFGVYGEWGQPIHSVGNDVRLLGLPVRRGDTAAAFRMLCRHNKYVQRFGKVRDPDEVALRERRWQVALEELEYETGRSPASLRGQTFARLLGAKLDLESFRPRAPRARSVVRRGR